MGKQQKSGSSWKDTFGGRIGHFDVSADNYSKLIERLVGARNGKAFWSGIVIRVEALVEQKTVIEELQMILAISSDDFKHQSNQGLVKYEGRWQDGGNWYYTVLYLLMLQVSSSHSEGGTCHGLLLALADKYSALQFDAPYTDTTVSLQGDVIECILATTRSKGASISVEVRKDRQAVHDNISKVLEGLRRCMFFLAYDEHLCVDDLPPTRVFVDLFQTAYCCS